MTTTAFRTITIFGSAMPAPGSAAYETARELGRSLAGHGYAICNGGYGGTMEATARGARESGGCTIGVTCRAFGQAGPNAYIQREVETDNLLERLDALVRLGDGYVVLPGGTGTLLEFALVWESLSKRLMPDERVLIVVGDFWRPVVDCVASQGADPKLVRVAEDALSVVEILEVQFSRGN